MTYSLDQPYLEMPLAHEAGQEKVHSLRYTANRGHCPLPMQSLGVHG